IANLDSRLEVPNFFKIKGPASEQYTFTCVSKAYYNNWDYLNTAQGADPKGFINIAGKLDVPFFKDLQAHLHTSAQQSNNTAPIFLMGGWPAHGWQIAGQDFFSQPTFDEDNQGYDTTSLGTGPSALDSYHNNSAEKYHVRAQQRWLGIVDFDYPLSWSSPTRSFKSFQVITNDLLVLSVQ